MVTTPNTPPPTVDVAASARAGALAGDHPLETIQNAFSAAGTTLSRTLNGVTQSDTVRDAGTAVSNAGSGISNWFHNLNWSKISGGVIGMGGAWLLASMFGGIGGGMFGGLLSTVMMLAFLPMGFFLGADKLSPILSNWFGGHSSNTPGAPSPSLAPATPGAPVPAQAPLTPAEQVYRGGQAAYDARDWRGDPAAPGAAPRFSRSNVAVGSYSSYDVPEAYDMNGYQVVGPVRPRGPIDNGGGYFRPVDNGNGYFRPVDNRGGYFNPYDNGRGYFNPYDNGRGTFNPYDNGSGTFNPVDNGRGGFNPVDNGRGTFNPVDNGPGTFRPVDNKPPRARS